MTLELLKIRDPVCLWILFSAFAKILLMDGNDRIPVGLVGCAVDVVNT